MVDEQEAAWRALLVASASTPAVQQRLSDFLRAAVAERQALVRTMRAAQRSGDLAPAAVASLKAAERESRLRLLQSLLDMGREVAAEGAAAAPDVQAAFRRTWLSSVNSLLAIDQVRVARLCSCCYSKHTSF